MPPADNPIQGTPLAVALCKQPGHDRGTCEVVVGIPHIVPDEANFTVSGQVWLDTAACRKVLVQLAEQYPDVDVYIGATDLHEPEAKIMSNSSNHPSSEILSSARVLARRALAEARRHVARGIELPSGIELVRTLEHDEVHEIGRVTEHRLELKDLSVAQSCELAARGWTTEAHGAKISLPCDAFVRERDWLLSQKFI